MLGTFRKRGPRGPLDGQPVLVIPGFLCSDQTTFSLRRELAEGGVSKSTAGNRVSTLERSPTRSKSSASGSTASVMTGRS